MFNKNKNSEEKSQPKVSENKTHEDIEDINEEETEELKSQEAPKSNEENDNKIKTLEEENKKLKESFMRTLADLENTRRISKEEQEKTMKYAVSRFSEDLIPVMENFYLAFNFIGDGDLDNGAKVKNFFDGIKLTQNELKKAFEKNGLVRIYPVNEKFNPDYHDAIAQIESDAEEGTILDVIQAGYKIKDRLLRPALVSVSKGKKED